MPPFHPNATVPVPAPTAPSSTVPSRADVMAAATCSRVTWRPRMSFRPPSLVSPTSAFTDRTFSLPGWASVQRTMASTATPTASVLVRTIGDSMVPSSCTCVDPASLPKALPTKTAPATFSTKEIPGVGKDCGHAGPHGVSRHQGRVADANAGDIRDGVERPRAAGAGLDAEVTRARTALRGDVDARDAPDECHHHQAADILVRVSSRAIQM